MKRIQTFVAGMLTAAVIGGLGVGALAASGAVTFNASNLMFNGQQISAKGEGYTLDNGCQAPASITYTDEKGGGTTYLPVRRISELLDVETGWDGTTGSVTIGKAADTTAVPADYSDWSEEEEAAYQEFKGMWEIETENGLAVQSITAKYNGHLSEEELSNLLLLSKDNIARFSYELADKTIATNPLWFYYKDAGIANVVMNKGNIFAIYVGDTRLE